MKRLLFVLMLTATACSPTQSYPGPTRARSEVGVVSFVSPAPMRISDSNINGVSQSAFDLGIAVAPGDHQFRTDYELTAEECVASEPCREEIRLGVCHGNVAAAAGGSYEVRVQAVRESAFVEVRDLHSGNLAGAGTCEERSYQSRVSHGEREKWRRDREQVRRDRWE